MNKKKKRKKNEREKREKLSTYVLRGEQTLTSLWSFTIVYMYIYYEYYCEVIVVLLGNIPSYSSKFLRVNYTDCQHPLSSTPLFSALNIVQGKHACLVNSLIDQRYARHAFRSLFVLVRPSFWCRILLLRLLTARHLATRRLLLLYLRLHLIQRVTFPFPDTMHRQKVYLEVLFRLELLVAHVTGDVLGLNCVHVHDVLLEVRIVRIDLPALRTLWFARLARVVGLMMLLLVKPTMSLLMEQRHALLNLLLGARLKHQIELVFRAGRLLLLLQRLKIVLQLLMHHRQLLGIQAIQGVERVQGI